MITDLKQMYMEETGRPAPRRWEELTDEQMFEDTNSLCILASHEYEQNGPSYA